MTTEPVVTEKTHQRRKVIYRNGSGGAIYGLGMIGAWVYFIGHATTFWLGLLGFLKGIVWPALLVYAALQSLGM